MLGTLDIGQDNDTHICCSEENKILKEHIGNWDIHMICQESLDGYSL